MKLKFFGWWCMVHQTKLLLQGLTLVQRQWKNIEPTYSGRQAHEMLLNLFGARIRCSMINKSSEDSSVVF